MSSPEAPTADADADAEAVAEATDEVRAGLLAALESELGDAVVGSHIKAGQGLWVRVRSEAWRAAGEAAKGKLGCKWFDFLSAIDWLPNPFGRYEEADIDRETSLADKVAAAKAAERSVGYAGGDTRLQVLAHVVNTEKSRGGQCVDVLLKADVPDESLAIESWTPVYAGSNWHEREAWEMFGITFEGHPGLRHIYLPTEFEGYPLRKDFPLLARVVKPWPGIVDVEQMPGERQDGDATGEPEGEAAEGDAAEGGEAE